MKLNYTLLAVIICAIIVVFNLIYNGFIIAGGWIVATMWAFDAYMLNKIIDEQKESINRLEARINLYRKL